MLVQFVLEKLEAYAKFAIIFDPPEYVNPQEKFRTHEKKNSDPRKKILYPQKKNWTHEKKLRTHEKKIWTHEKKIRIYEKKIWTHEGTKPTRFSTLTLSCFCKQKINLKDKINRTGLTLICSLSRRSFTSSHKFVNHLCT